MNRFESKYFSTALLMDEALLCLLEKKNFKSITIKEVCNKAGVNRSTFYLHYDSTDDLLAEAIEMINKRFLSAFSGKNNKIKNISSMKKEDLIFISPEYLTPYLEFIRENKRVFKTIHSNPKLFEVEKTFSKMYVEIFKPVLKKFDITDENQNYIFEFFTKGVLAIILKWIDLDCKDSIEHIQNIILDCVDVTNRKK